MRALVAAFVCFWNAFDSPLTGIAYAYELSIPIFFLTTSILHYLAAARWQSQAVIYGLFMLDILFLGALFSLMNPFVEVNLTRASLFQFANFQWFFIFLGHAALSLDWRMVVWCGFWVGFVRVAQTLYAVADPNAYVDSDLDPWTVQGYIDAIFDPNFVSIAMRVSELVSLAGVTATLAFAVSRTKRVVLDQALAERHRSALARHFSPNIADMISRDDTSRAPVRRKVAVMFVDIVGFTGLAEQYSAEQVVSLLRSFYARMTAIVFDHNGTLDKFLGDGLMVSFNTPTDIERPASQAIACALALLDDMERISDGTGAADGRQRLQIGIGIHWGEAVTGDIGDERRLEYAVIGDVVNVASRLEAETRNRDTWLIVSADLLSVTREEGTDVHDFKPIGALSLRGRKMPVEAFGYLVAFGRDD